jgi:hypothetical protein
MCRPTFRKRGGLWRWTFPGMRCTKGCWTVYLAALDFRRKYHARERKRLLTAKVSAKEKKRGGR